jgi:DNA-binding LacI/PurR family transcriptional regulator
MIFLDPNDPTPKYQQLRQGLLREMEQGRLRPGDQLPPEAELAQQFGLSRHTVRAALDELAGSGHVERIHGRGTFVRETVGARGGVWGILVHDIRYPLWPEIVRGLEDEAHRHGIHILVCSTDEDPSRQSDFLQQMVARRVEGVVINPVRHGPHNPADFESLRRAGIPFVFCARSVEGIAAPLVVCDNVLGGRLATEHLLALGHRRIAYLSSTPTAATEARRQGYEQVLREAGLTPRPEDVYYGPPRDPVEGYAGMQALLKLPNPPTAVFCGGDRLAWHAYRALREVGWHVPEEISLVGFDDVRPEPGFDLALTTIAWPKYEAGQAAGRLLLQMRGRARAVADEVLLKPWLVPRRSTGYPRTGAEAPRQGVAPSR